MVFICSGSNSQAVTGRSGQQVALVSESPAPSIRHRQNPPHLDAAHVVGCLAVKCWTVAWRCPARNIACNPVPQLKGEHKVALRLEARLELTQQPPSNSQVARTMHRLLSCHQTSDFLERGDSRKGITLCNSIVSCFEEVVSANDPIIINSQH